MPEWMSPSNAVDATNNWGQAGGAPIGNAIDDNESSYTSDLVTVLGGDWSAYLYLYTGAKFNCSGVRFKPFKGAHDVGTQIDIYYGGDWHNVYDSNDHTSAQWEDVWFATQEISSARYRMETDSYISVYLYEFDFWFKSGVSPPAPSVTYSQFNTPTGLVTGWAWNSGQFNSASGMRATSDTPTTWEWSVISSSSNYFYPSGTSTGWKWVSGSAYT